MRWKAGEGSRGCPGHRCRCLGVLDSLTRGVLAGWANEVGRRESTDGPGAIVVGRRGYCI